MGTVSYIPLGQPFLKTVVSGLIRRVGDNPAGLMDIEILLPTRRAVRAITDLFLDMTDGRPILLPRLRAVADIDDDALEILVATTTQAPVHLPPALSSLESQLVLAELIRKRDTDIDFERSIALAQGLLDFLKSIRDEGLTLDRLDHLVEAEFAAHWQITVDFLNILRDVWPQYLKAAGRMDVYDRRDALFNELMVFWRDHPPKHPVIMAGITGSLPHIASLMQVVATLPQGDVILPGFDPHLPDRHQKELDPQHPQYELNRVIQKMGLTRDQIDVWNEVEQGFDEHAVSRGHLLRHMMCPGSCTADWIKLKDQINLDALKAIQGDLKNIAIISVEKMEDEARVIAMNVRYAIEDDHKNIAIITPDRSLSSAIIAACQQCGIDVNDSAGQVLKTCAAAQFITAVLQVATQGFTPLALMELLRHPLYGLDGFNHHEVYLLEKSFLRGIRPPPEPTDFLRSFQNRNISGDIFDHLSTLWSIINPLRMLIKSGGSILDIARMHVNVAEQLSKKSLDDVSAIWVNEDGEELSRVFQTILDLNIPMLDISGNDYESFVIHLLNNHRVNWRGVGHPRVALLGVYESRLIGIDHVILAGFNEGFWPVDPGVDPWLSRGMRHDFGLPPLEQSIGRLAHDLVQLMHAQQVTITYRSRSEGVPVLPSRWLHRFYSVLKSLWGDNHHFCQSKKWVDAARLLDAPKSTAISDVMRPAPRPPIALRPIQFSATQIETWMTDPYAFYAQKILRLRPLDPLDQEADDRIRGIILHAALERIMDDGTYYHMTRVIHDLLNEYGVDQSLRAFLSPRLMNILNRTEEFDRIWRSSGHTPLGVEQTWDLELDIQGEIYHITARLDRLDQDQNQNATVIDYKTGAALPTFKDIESGMACQLIIQALCVRSGVHTTTRLQFSGQVMGAALWHLKPRGVKAMSIDRDDPDRNLNDLCDQAHQGISNLIQVFQQIETPYYPVPDPSRMPNRLLYDHLSRRKIWWGIS